MTVPSNMQDLARLLLDCEAVPGEISKPMEAATIRVYEKLRQNLCVVAGVAGFQSLAFRAVTLAKSEVPALWAVQVAVDGSLQGLGETGAQPSPGIDLDGNVGVILIARLIELLQIFLGDTLTLSLLRNSWPNAALDESNSESRRKA